MTNRCKRSPRTVDFHLGIVDLTDIPEARQRDEAVALAHHEAQLPFDIGQLPLIRVTMLRCPPIMPSCW